MANLYDIQKELADQLAIVEFLAAENNGIIPDEAANKLDLLEMQLSDKQEGLCQYIRNMEADAISFKAEAERFAKKQKQAENRAVWVKKYLASTVPPNGEEVGMFKLSWRKSESVVLSEGYEDDDLSALYDNNLLRKYIRRDVKFTLDKKAIKDGIKAGAEISFAKIVPSNNLQIG